MSLHLGSKQLLETGLFPEDTERSYENEVRGGEVLLLCLVPWHLFIACPDKEMCTAVWMLLARGQGILQKLGRQPRNHI